MKRNRLNSNRGSRTEMGENSRGAPAAHKDVKNEGRSGNVNENKGPCDNLPDRKDDISAWLHAILHKNARIFQETSPLLSLFGHSGANLLLQNVEIGQAKCRGPALGPRIPSRESRVPLAEKRRFQIQDSRFRTPNLTANRQSKIGISARVPSRRFTGRGWSGA